MTNTTHITPYSSFLKQVACVNSLFSSAQVLLTYFLIVVLLCVESLLCNSNSVLRNSKSLLHNSNSVLHNSKSLLRNNKSVLRNTICLQRNTNQSVTPKPI